ncbi:hypothetical protein BU25DRAFT_446586 [Macroventuria anomochaeta]|uniref:Uncharacterized protein n=1 Tax=Macroventuria anomochaeta TaxID=301207 RepID=A0ACB6S8Q3_9PLEO|nr:uncharacterized protein BU25DRAFT_446586 [Macroventuria anomochaeta]KAF2630343.1 hypothetical protein BU25DRAFT_446586 [Macroventuria anomochaeta]
MALTWPRLLTILNGGALFVSLALVGISPAILYLTSHGMRWMNKAYPQGYYEWYRGPSYDMDTKHKVRLMYESTNEYMIFTAAAVSAIAGLVGIIGFFLTRKTSKPTSSKSTLFLLVLPGSVTFVITLIAFMFTQIVYDTDNKGKCNWEQGYNPGNVFKCTREQAACNIVGYFTMENSKIQQIFDTKRGICGETQTGRHLVAPLFVASLLMCGLTVAKFLVEKKESRFVESADERVERLEGQEE